MIKILENGTRVIATFGNNQFSGFIIPPDDPLPTKPKKGDIVEVSEGLYTRQYQVVSARYGSKKKKLSLTITTIPKHIN
jgi:hypothetical protein